ncbi:MAG TPA: alpha-hydroxy acid oxidase [Pseudolabrys sp.]|nr:alpha-hydroxy acid oxidase [Pseudolabrys sp.]
MSTTTSDIYTAPPQGAAPVAVTTRPQASVPYRLRRYLALDDFETVARKRLPRMIYGYVSGAVETGSALRQAREAYHALALVPRTLMDVSGRKHDATLFGRPYVAPFGIAPMGGAAMIAYRGDLTFAEAAGAFGVPYIQSAASLTRLEDVRAANPQVWFQAYLPGDMSRITPMITRVAAAGYETLVVTADTIVPGNRENNVRSGFSMPLRPTPRTAIDALLHPRWLFGTIARTFMVRGNPHFENMDASRGPPMIARNVMRNFANRDQLAWRHIEAIRKQWKGNLVVKGLLSGGDTRKARELGVDGVIASSHGGRQLDYAIGPLAALPEMAAEAGSMTMMIDGGIRRGTDVLKALALGAKFVFVGRPFLYAASIGGVPAVMHAMRLLTDEINRDMALIGARNLGEITADMVRRA